MEQDVVEVRVRQANLSIFVRMNEEPKESVKEALDLIAKLKEELGPNIILEQLSLMLNGTIDSVELRGCEAVEIVQGSTSSSLSSAAQRASLGGYVPSLHWAKGKSLAELDPSLLRYAIDFDQAGGDAPAILDYLVAIGYGGSTALPEVDYEDDDIPF